MIIYVQVRHYVIAKSFLIFSLKLRNQISIKGYSTLNDI